MLSGPQILRWTDALFKAFSDEEFADVLLRLDTILVLVPMSAFRFLAK
jgi:hypothetical protein